MQTYCYKLYDSKKTKVLEWMMAEAAFTWNHALALQRRYFRIAKACGWDRTYVSAADMQKHFARRIARKRLDAQTVQELLQRQDAAFRLFFNRTTRRPPKFRRAKDFSSFVFKQTGYKLYGNEFIINRVSKRFKFAKSRDWEGKVKNVRVFRSRQRWYILVVTDAEPKRCGKTHTGASAGMDFGLKTFITLSDGTTVEHPRFYRQLERRIAKRQKLLSQSVKGSNHYYAHRRALNRLYAELTDRRSDWQYKTAHALCRTYDALFVEDLSLKGMTRLWGKKVNDLGWASFLQALEYVASKYGVLLHRVDRWYASTKTCGCCGYVNKSLTLNDRSWTCPQCGTHHDRDLNAAQNIRRRGIADLGSIGKTCLSVATAGTVR